MLAFGQGGPGETSAFPFVKGQFGYDLKNAYGEGSFWAEFHLHLPVIQKPKLLQSAGAFRLFGHSLDRTNGRLIWN